jgi:Alpha/beta hydrolase
LGVGSPGVGVNSAAQLGIPASHVWAGANVNDSVPDLPPRAEALLPQVMEDGFAGGVGGLVTGGLHGMKTDAEKGALLPLLLVHANQPYAGYFGTNPATPAFGGNDFTANYMPDEPSTFDLNHFLTFKAHSSYWTPNSASLFNIAHIVDGQCSDVALASSAGASG